MSNQIAEYIIKVVRHQSAKWLPRFLIPRFAILCERKISALCSFKNWATTNLLPTSSGGLRVCVSERCHYSFFSQGWGQKWSLPLLSLATDALMAKKLCRLLEGKATEPIEQQAENRSDNWILGNNYHLFAGHAFVTRNWNQTTRHSLLRGRRGWLGTRLRFSILQATESWVGPGNKAV